MTSNLSESQGIYHDFVQTQEVSTQISTNLNDENQKDLQETEHREIIQVHVTNSVEPSETISEVHESKVIDS